MKDSHVQSTGDTLSVAARPWTRRLAFAVLIIGLTHYGIACIIWATWIRGFGIDRFNYGYYVRDALPALVFALTYFSSVIYFANTKRSPIVVTLLLILATACHFAIDERLHHFTVQMMTTDRGCIHFSPTWWWYEHRCGRLSSG
jgi:hypothetical protein